MEKSKLTWHEWREQMKRNPLYRLSEAIRAMEPVEPDDEGDSYERHCETEAKAVRRV